MATMDEIRAGVCKTLPEINDIKDPELRKKVVECWALALSQTEYASLDDMPGSASPEVASMKGLTQGDHMRVVARMAVAWADAVDSICGPLPFNRDYLIASAILHDVGKPYEFSPRNRARWREDPTRYGFPGIRHPAYGAHLALTVGLPEPIAHAIAAHCFEGVRYSRSLEGTIAHLCDYGFWEIANRSGLLGKQEAGMVTLIPDGPIL